MKGDISSPSPSGDCSNRDPSISVLVRISFIAKPISAASCARNVLTRRHWETRIWGVGLLGETMRATRGSYSRPNRYTPLESPTGASGTGMPFSTQGRIMAAMRSAATSEELRE